MEGSRRSTARDIAELLVFDGVLSSGEHLAVARYLNQRFGVLPLIGATNLTAEVLSPTQAFVHWEGVNVRTNSVFELERKTEESETYGVIAALTNAFAMKDTNLAGGTTYYGPDGRIGLPQRGLNSKAQGNALGITPAISPSPERAKDGQSARSEFEMFSIAALQGLGTFWHGYSQAVGLGCIIAAPSASGRICGGGGARRTVEIPIAARTADRQKKSHPQPNLRLTKTRLGISSAM